MLYMAYSIIGNNKGSTIITHYKGILYTKPPKIYRTPQGVWGKDIYLNIINVYFWKIDYRVGIIHIQVEDL